MAPPSGEVPPPLTSTTGCSNSRIPAAMEMIPAAFGAGYNLTKINLGLLKVEVLAEEGEEADDEVDEVDVAEVILRMIMKSKPVNRTGVTEDKEKAEKINQELSVLSVASTATMQTSRVELEKLKKTAPEKEEKASSVIEPDKNREEDEEEMKANEISTNSVGASNHMCGNENFFYELTKVEAKFVFFGDDSKVTVKGRGIIQHIQNDGRVGEIRDVYYVPELKSNILSMGQIIEKGNSIFMKNQVKAKKNQLHELELKILERRYLKQDMTSKTFDNSNSNMIERSKG
ncbi:uncharacterized protein LOC106776699 [Vigna radiata var. radiata]|uniref:Uncharacterized protein LOC106776699 n=1 Tax=Vigna radiata var. radiata TaxID=3916 RepID=A0A1S3VMR0_VIGRR|nr:uncharacterized protein LOC106776699 [Vigna radiata var. radiata]